MVPSVWVSLKNFCLRLLNVFLLIRLCIGIDRALFMLVVRGGVLTVTYIICLVWYPPRLFFSSLCLLLLYIFLSYCFFLLSLFFYFLLGFASLHFVCVPVPPYGFSTLASALIAVPQDSSSSSSSRACGNSPPFLRTFCSLATVFVLLFGYWYLPVCSIYLGIYPSKAFALPL